MGSEPKTINLSARSIKPKPSMARPAWPARGGFLVKNSHTPTHTNRGLTHARSSVRARAIKAEPASAPKPSAKAPSKLTSPCAAKEFAIKAVALLLCVRQVAAAPPRNAQLFLDTHFDNPRRNPDPKTRSTPVRATCAPQIRSATALKRFNSVCIAFFPWVASGREGLAAFEWRSPLPRRSGARNFAANAEYSAEKFCLQPISPLFAIHPSISIHFLKKTTPRDSCGLASESAPYSPSFASSLRFWA